MRRSGCSLLEVYGSLIIGIEARRFQALVGEELDDAEIWGIIRMCRESDCEFELSFH